jgi:hypothetical protein
VYGKWEKPMPRIPDVVADCSFYLYKTEREARLGKDTGGCGFLVKIDSANPSFCHLYAVTNRHVIDDGFLTLRLNLKVGGADFKVTTKEDWFPHPDGDDVAILPLDLSGDFRFAAVETELFLDRESIGIYDIGYGDDVFMVGRLMSHSGREKNTPVLRFGSISLMVDENEKVRLKDCEQEAFLVECRSISGFSGSPVFILSNRGYQKETYFEIEAYEHKKFRKPGNPSEPWPDVTPNLGLKLPSGVSKKIGPILLGIDFAHLPDWNHVFKKIPNRATMGETDYWAASASGIAAVVPAWKILDLLNTPKLVDDRAERDLELTEKMEKIENPFVLDSAKGQESPEFTKQDFEADLQKASRRVSLLKSDLETK